MRNRIHNQYSPDTVSPPGETLKETLEALGMSQAELADRMGRPKKTINEIIKGKAALTADTALQLERVLGVPAGFWNKRDNHYREFLAQRQENARLGPKVGWLDTLPLRDMIKLGWVAAHPDRVLQLRAVLDFFGVASPEVWKRIWYGPKVSYRRSQAFQNDPGLLAGWLRLGEIRARAIACAPYDAARFGRALAGIRTLIPGPPARYARELSKRCAASGVALVFLPEPPRLSISGATRWLSPTKALMQISLRYTTDDQFWLTFFHEAGHIQLHGKRDVFLETEGLARAEEEAADQFALLQLLPKGDLARFAKAASPTAGGIREFSARHGLAPGVVVGLLQHQGLLPHSRFNEMKRLFRLKTP